MAPQVTGGWQHNYSIKTRQAGLVKEQYIYSHLSMAGHQVSQGAPVNWQVWVGREFHSNYIQTDLSKLILCLFKNMLLKHNLLSTFCEEAIPSRTVAYPNVRAKQQADCEKLR